MHGVISKVENGKLLLTLAKEFFQREAVFTTMHKFSSRCGIEIFPVGEYEVGVWLAPGTGMTLEDLQQTAQDFSEELIDQ